MPAANKRTQTAAKPPAAKTSAAPQMAFASADLAEEGGQGLVLAAVPEGKAHVRLATFVVDTQCLGVRKVTFSELPLAAFLNQGLSALHAVPVPVGTARAIVEGAAAYARKLGFAAPENLAAALAYFGDTPADAKPPFPFGKDGVPHYQQQPGDSDEFAESILRRLEVRPGPGKFTYSLEEPSEEMVDGEDPEDAENEGMDEDADSDNFEFDSGDE